MELDNGSGSGFRYYPNVFSSIFFLKECGDLFQEISACIKSQSGYHNYLTNDIPSIIRYFLLMKLLEMEMVLVLGFRLRLVAV